MSRTSVLALCLAGLLSGFAWIVPVPHVDGNDQERPVISIEEFQTSNVIGRLGVPLGQVVVIEGDTVKDVKLPKGHDGTMSLTISSVDQRRLKTPVDFWDEHIRDDNGRPVRLSEGRYRLAAYESGRFEGVPQGDEKYRPVRAGRRFYFQSELWIVHNFEEQAAPRQK